MTLDKIIKGLIVAFDATVMREDLHHFSVQLLAAPRNPDGNKKCWCEVEIKIERGTLEKKCVTSSDFHESESDITAIRISPLLDDVQIPLDFRVVIKGDFIRDTGRDALDADHLPPWLPRQITGDGVPGGTFESWFSMTP